MLGFLMVVALVLFSFSSASGSPVAKWSQEDKEAILRTMRITVTFVVLLTFAFVSDLTGQGNLPLAARAELAADAEAIYGDWAYYGKNLDSDGRPVWLAMTHSLDHPQNRGHLGMACTYLNQLAVVYSWNRSLLGDEEGQVFVELTFDSGRKTRQTWSIANERIAGIGPFQSAQDFRKTAESSERVAMTVTDPADVP